MQPESERRYWIATAAAVLCLFMPFFAQLPYGVGAAVRALPFVLEWRSLGECILAFFYFGMFVLPSMLVVFFSIAFARPRWYLMGWFAVLAVFAVMGWGYSGREWLSDAQGPLAYLFMPVYAAIAGIFGAALGQMLQPLLCFVLRGKPVKQ